jgi:hypothetical protein
VADAQGSYVGVRYRSGIGCALGRWVSLGPVGHIQPSSCRIPSGPSRSRGPAGTRTLQHFRGLLLAATAGRHLAVSAAGLGQLLRPVPLPTGETWRPDYPQYSSFNASCGGCLFGKPVGGFRDEFWLNINTNVSGVNPNTGQTETAQQFIIDELSARLDKARSLGVDAIEFDNVDAYQNKTGLTISAATQEQFDATIANLAHSKGFTVGLKNDLGQANDLQPYFDFAINEQCWQYNECNYPPPGLQVWPGTYGKAVFNVEYKLAASKFCLQANSASYNFNSILKNVNLYDVPYTPCR